MKPLRDAIRNAIGMTLVDLALRIMTPQMVADVRRMIKES